MTHNAITTYSTRVLMYTAIYLIVHTRGIHNTPKNTKSLGSYRVAGLAQAEKEVAQNRAQASAHHQLGRIGLHAFKHELRQEGCERLREHRLPLHRPVRSCPLNERPRMCTHMNEMSQYSIFMRKIRTEGMSMGFNSTGSALFISLNREPAMTEILAIESK